MEVEIDGKTLNVMSAKLTHETDESIFGLLLPTLKMRIHKESASFVELLELLYKRNEHTIEFIETHKYYITTKALKKFLEDYEKPTKTIRVEFVGTLNE